MIALETPFLEIKGIGPKFVAKLKNLGVLTVKDLLWHFPFRYENFAAVKKIADLKINEQATVSGIIEKVKVQRTWKKKMFIVEAVILDDTGSISAVWFNQRHLAAILKKGQYVNFAGKVVSKKNKIYLSSPVYEFINQKLTTNNQQLTTKHTARLVPIYPETKGLTPKALRYLIKPILDDLERLDDFLSRSVLKKFNFPEINQALYSIHFPDNLEAAKVAKRRFAFEDLFLLQLINLRQRLKLAKQKAFSFEAADEFIEKLFKNLPFELTESQKKSFFEILNDLKKSQPMNRLLQGDVGSGKTIVAALAAIIVSEPFDSVQGKQSVFMAPTEVLARQHYETIKRFFPKFNKGLGLLISSETKIFYGDDLEQSVKKSGFLNKVSLAELKIIIGTHALIQKGVKFKNLAFVVIDEQHRFGVSQRASLVTQESAFLPHFLSMSATPIPRTLTLTIFSDLNLSIISELPKNRKPVITKIVAPENRDKAYAFIRGQVKKGRQAFVICPRIDPTQTNAGSLRQSALPWETKAVKEEYEKLSKKVFPDLKVGMLHGKMKAKEKEKIMSTFAKATADKKIDILVSTSVVEVGVDIPNATIMMIEGAEKFGLAQLYQFRGRVGRGEHQSFCFLFTDSFSKTTRERLESLLQAKNGFELAEKDLAIRGPGEILGESQTGLPDLAMKAIQNPDLVKVSRQAAEELLEEDPNFENQPVLKNRLDLFQKEVHLE